MILCAHCGRQNGRRSRFCTACGSRLQEQESCTVGRLVSLDENGRSYLLADVDRVIGRDPGADIVVDDPEVSGRHARISWQDGAFRIEDLASTNGTLVNGQPVCRGPLHHDDVLKLGRTLLRFEL